MNLRVVRWADIFAGIPLAYAVHSLKKMFGRPGNAWRGGNPGRILVVKFWGIGNIMMLLPTALALKEKHPQAQIDLLTLRHNEDVAQAVDIFDDVHTVDTAGVTTFIATSAQNLGRLRRRDYDLIIDFEQFARFSALFICLIGKGATIGFNTAGQHRHFLYRTAAPYKNDIHMTESFAGLAGYSGGEHRDMDCLPGTSFKRQTGDEGKLPSAPRSRTGLAWSGPVRNMLLDRGISDNNIMVVLHVGTSENFKLRRWPAEYYSELADRLIDDFGVKIVLTASVEERDLAGRVMKRLRGRSAAVDLSGQLTFRQFFALIRLSDLLVSSDTAPVHIASYLSRPVVGLYGPNTPQLYGPWGNCATSIHKNLNCSPCITNYNAKISKCRHPQGRGACMKQIVPTEVFDKIRRNYFDEDAPFRLQKLKDMPRLEFYQRSL